MADAPQNKLPHLHLVGTVSSSKFVSPKGGGSRKRPTQNRQAHGSALLGQMQQIKLVAKEITPDQEAAGVEPDKVGVYVEFDSEPGFELKLESLEAKKGLEIVSVKELDNQTLAAYSADRDR